MAEATEDRHRKVLVSPQTTEDKGMNGYAFVSGLTTKYRFGEPTSLRASVIRFLKDAVVVTRTHEEYTDLDGKRKKRVIKKSVARYRVTELGKNFKLGEEFEGIVDTEGNFLGNKEGDQNHPEANL